ncbi:hypothetical protein [Streptomyces noursei]|uniref:Uncharacterized protein n=1 Tax=Streptomyces noursei TaxID=1971 RepID=A0A2N8PQU6_STRNR|nr:hypothetical protein [Streptomyces noursei]PNE43406.1 hypothetical protein AOB60_00205 [Streptomyces noursei]
MQPNEGPDANSPACSLYERGEALARFADSINVVPSYFDRTTMGGLFFEEKLVGAAMAAMLAWLESRWGPIAVRAAQKEANYHTDDESCIGAVPSFNSAGKRLAVGDEVVGQAHGLNGEVRTFEGRLTRITPTYWNSELCPTGLVVEGPNAPQGSSWSYDWHDLTKRNSNAQYDAKQVVDAAGAVQVTAPVTTSHGSRRKRLRTALSVLLTWWKLRRQPE